MPCCGVDGVVVDKLGVGRGTPRSIRYPLIAIFVHLSNHLIDALLEPPMVLGW